MPVNGRYRWCRWDWERRRLKPGDSAFIALKIFIFGGSRNSTLVEHHGYGDNNTKCKWHDYF